MSKRLLSTIFVIIVGIGSLLLLQGCDKEETLTPQDFAPPTNLRALSRDTSVVLFWTHSTANGVSEFAGYRVQTFNSSNLKIDSVFTTTNTYTLHNPTNRGFGITNGSTYSFSVRAVKSNGDVSIADSIQWGPTIRYQQVKIFEFDSDSVSGLKFAGGNRYSFTSGPPKGDNRGVIDLWLDGRNDVDMLLKSPDDHSLSTGWRTTKLYDTNVNSLEEAVVVPAEGSFRTTPGLTIVAGRVYLAITADGNYARFQVTSVDNAAANNNRSVTIVIAYNTGSGAWAKH
ncbi:MAG: fibronectin type III domain-containing protein [Bacteroidetes bacterium]|nr:MAG: fibronectin type III domain-containing protein [Bacteroidota bacterium]